MVAQLDQRLDLRADHRQRLLLQPGHLGTVRLQAVDLVQCIERRTEVVCLDGRLGVTEQDPGARLTHTLLFGPPPFGVDAGNRTQLLVDHAKPHCHSYELWKGILEDRARAVFNGRIRVHQDAQKTDGVQSNRNLLLSKEALVHSNPQLEIFADDVRCTHGATVGQLDDTAIFYLRSRGIGEEAARSLLTYAFAADIVERIKVEPVRRDLEEFLFRRLPKGDIVRQAV
mgnify:CR=1 FL=1